MIVSGACCKIWTEGVFPRDQDRSESRDHEQSGLLAGQLQCWSLIQMAWAGADADGVYGLDPRFDRPRGGGVGSGSGSQLPHCRRRGGKRRGVLSENYYFACKPMFVWCSLVHRSAEHAMQFKMTQIKSHFALRSGALLDVHEDEPDLWQLLAPVVHVEAASSPIPVRKKHAKTTTHPRKSVIRPRAGRRPVTSVVREPSVQY